MESERQMQQQHNGGKSNKVNEDGLIAGKPTKGKKQINYKWWIRIAVYIFFMLAGQTAGVLLGRLYFSKGGHSTWLATVVQSAGFPIVIPLLIYFSKSRTSPPKSTGPPLYSLLLIYTALGLIAAGDNMMYSYGLLYLPVSTYSLLCATQLAFNVVFSFFLNAQKFTILIFNSVVLLTISAALLAFNSGSDGGATTISEGKYVIGYVCTVGASATYSLYLCLVQLAFEKVIKKQTFNMILDMQFFPSLVATLGSLVGLFATEQWRTLAGEMRVFQAGRASYVLTLAFTAISWQVSVLGMLGLIYEVSSLFSNAISTLALPLVPIFAVIFFHDKMNGVKVISLLLALWGFFSYVYQHYLDDTKGKKAKAKAKTKANDATISTIDIC
ncbi:hypothetical protein Droror1_Dr00014579 [Drosera rotundifolia]